ncbi:PREDICTED: probable LRR receptor-like serine/threonine-protein kinase At3g47570 [Ipomoea nil]|uniref:probable LRR receptor-like serine/threonine-protein kinase At3g47570 n=1 Tax=Ipomoea nil TaxID=35883 RepID=UPI0009014992|nr:PREDICTED: probable LRR receptor-like serine/threonine-protein kinase At3g47570 [Ipomoea nil]
MAFPTPHFFSTKPILSLYFFTFLVLGSALISSASKLPGNETDIISLLEFKKMIKDDPFGVMASWNETIHFCGWPGVLFGRRHLRVMSLNLRSLKLVGSLTPHIGNLSFLKALDLQNNSFSDFSYNNLTCNIPSDLGTLNNLQVISFIHNNLVGKIPHSLGNLSLLNSFAVSINNLFGEIPDSLCKLSKLQYLLVSQNNLSGIIPPSLFNHSSMLAINLAGNHIRGTLHPNLFVTLPHLLYFSIYENNFVGSIPVTLSNATQMQMFSVTDNKMTGKVQTLESCKNYKGSWPENKIDGEIPLEIGYLSNLRVLGLFGNNFFGKIPSSIGNLTLLLHLSFGGNYLHDTIPASLGKCQNLEFLDLSRNNLSGHIPKEVLELSSLSLFLDLSDNNFIGSIPKEVQFLTNLGILDLSYNSFSGTIPPELGSCVYLEILNLTNNNLEGPIPSTLENLRFKVLIDLLRHGASRIFVAECEILKNTKHRKLVKVLTACSGFDLQKNDFKALVYEYMDNGNLENWLHFSSQETFEIEENRMLSFSQRLNILIDVANALDYLHNNCESAIIHCDLKPSNVLLDKNMTAHVSDFGLARFVQQRIQSSSSDNHSSIGVQGTVGYAPPEYGMGSKPSKAGDVYSFGILILEMLTGKRPTHELFQDGLNLHSYAKAALAYGGVEIADPKLLHERDEQTQMRKKRKS